MGYGIYVFITTRLRQRGLYRAHLSCSLIPRCSTPANSLRALIDSRTPCNAHADTLLTYCVVKVIVIASSKSSSFLLQPSIFGHPRMLCSRTMKRFSGVVVSDSENPERTKVDRV